MTIRIYTIGKIKEQYLTLGINEYITRIKPYCNVEIKEVKDEKVNDNPTNAEIEIVKNKEADSVLKLLKNNEYLIALDLNKKEMTSEEFAEFLDKKLEISGSNLSFVIGGSYGLGDELKKRCNDSISLSKMTFLHQMTRLILLEQIYRAFKINRHEVYHKWFLKNSKT